MSNEPGITGHNASSVEAEESAREQILQLPDPLVLFNAWLAEAEASELNDANAAALATASADGEPSVRMVLVKRADERGFSFFSNAESAKGEQLAANARAALCFHWKSLRRQVRVAGRVTEMAPADVDAYFHSRGRRSQIGAAVSSQSRPLASRAVLEEQVRNFTAQNEGEIPRPDYWRGYTIRAHSVEFWLDGPDRLHDRFQFTHGEEGWARTRLYP